MTKSQLVEAIALDANITKVAAKKAMDSFIKSTINAIRDDEKLTITGLGTFSVIQKSARIGRNPRTGAQVKIAPKKAVKFRSTIVLDQ